MRAYLPAYELVTPPNLGEALALLASGDWRPFAGGTDLMVLAEAGKLPHRRWVSLWGLPELRGITATEEKVSLGALTTYTEVRRSELLRREFPLLGQAAAETGGVAIQSRGTLGGNIANASPAADSPPALLVYDAELELVSARGSRRVPYAGFHRGYRQMDLAKDELIRAIHLPRRAWETVWRDAYRKVGTRRAQAISKVCFAAALRRDGERVAEVRLAFGSVAPVPLRCARTETVLRGQRLTAELVRAALAELAREIAPIDDFRSTAGYRLRVGQNLLADFLAP
ncbi:MAG TPA: xanthine dehydrogenase family protein subunit M [Thermoanaerobaculia bacterium]|jgi:CO/xanthine dehydrogenase FAD-binding subunit|nr:xanthine dehydrogenase family protein subunit M [Thermoanaerobaculia bacterium]